MSGKSNRMSFIGYAVPSALVLCLLTGGQFYPQDFLCVFTKSLDYVCAADKVGMVLRPTSVSVEHPAPPVPHKFGRSVPRFEDERFSFNYSRGFQGVNESHGTDCNCRLREKIPVEFATSETGRAGIAKCCFYGFEDSRVFGSKSDQEGVLIFADVDASIGCDESMNPCLFFGINVVKISFVQCVNLMRGGLIQPALESNVHAGFFDESANIIHVSPSSFGDFFVSLAGFVGVDDGQSLAFWNHPPIIWAAFGSGLFKREPNVIRRSARSISNRNHRLATSVGGSNGKMFGRDGSRFFQWDSMLAKNSGKATACSPSLLTNFFVRETGNVHCCDLFTFFGSRLTLVHTHNYKGTS